MRKFPMVAAMAMFPAFALVFLVGCPGPTTDPTPAAKPGATTTVEGKTGGAKVKGGEIKGELEATITGTVKFKGDIPKRELIAAIKEHKDAKVCEMGDVNKQAWTINDKGGVANVVVSLAPPTGMKYKVTDAVKKTKPEILDQPQCAFVPHVVAVMADVQPLHVLNSASVSHNVKIEAAGDNPAYDKIIGPKTTDPIVRTFSKWAKPIDIQCSVHGWMNAKVHVFDHPYFAVSKDDGSFEIKNVPIDTELTIYMWHESKAAKWEAKKMTFKKGDNSLELEISK